MIPKIIHYCWFGPNEKPASFYKWLKTWKRHLPDYEIMEWNESNFDVNLCNYSREAYLIKNYAFVSDVCRIYALYTIGGVYLDTDVEICQPLDEFLISTGSVGYESELIGTGVLISPPRSEWTEAFLQYYMDHHFVNIWGHPNRLPNTEILTYNIIPKLSQWLRPKIYPLGYFMGIEKEINHCETKPYTAAIHHYEASWKRKKTFKEKLRILKEGILIRYFKRCQ